ncbi:MAG: CTP synthase [Paludibacteraceae bacterium]|nr:CTP synthase [Paludibacteraceae bacterium]
MGQARYIFVTGGVSSSLGKGIIVASLGMLLQARGFKVSIQKFDPYVNINSGLLNPRELGECYVTDDGLEADVDLGHYERFLDVRTTKNSCVTSGRIYKSVIEKERKGDYLGKTVQVIPHITDEIKRRIKQGKAEDCDFVISEIGGTVGDIESLPFIESIRQMVLDNPRECLCIHLTYIPFLAASQELKTKPTQHSVKALLEMGVLPDVLVLRTEHKLPKELKRKVALFCNVTENAVVEAIGASSIYEEPLNLYNEGLDKAVLRKFGIPLEKEPAFEGWKRFANRMKRAANVVRIGLVGKYVEAPDAYRSISEALLHAAVAQNLRLELSLFQADQVTDENVAKKLNGLDAVLVAPGFGQRGGEGKIAAAKYARIHNIPFFGIGLGMQCGLVEIARNVVGLRDAELGEVNGDADHPIFALMEKEKAALKMTGTMRLGAYDCQLVEASLVRELYGADCVSERHRNRFEFDNQYREVFEKAGVRFSGVNPQTGFVEIVEMPSHRWYVGTLFQPEFKSTVMRPHPLFMGFVKAAVEGREL